MSTEHPSPDSRLPDLLKQSAALHRHLCPRQVLGIRMGLLAGRLLDTELPQTNPKRLFVFMETDGCAADGVAVATGCWVGHRTLRIVHFGKVAATFADRKTGRAFRLAPRTDARQAAVEALPQAKSRWQAMLEAYQWLPDAALLEAEEVALSDDLEHLISRPSARAVCQRCGEEVFNELEVVVDGEILCRSCAGASYYHPLGEPESG